MRPPAPAPQLYHRIITPQQRPRCEGRRRCRAAPLGEKNPAPLGSMFKRSLGSLYWVVSGIKWTWLCCYNTRQHLLTLATNMQDVTSHTHKRKCWHNHIRAHGRANVSYYYYLCVCASITLFHCSQHRAPLSCGAYLSLYFEYPVFYYLTLWVGRGSIQTYVA